MEREEIALSPNKSILIAPLDWGLGHATRCMPLIDILLEQGHKVIIAGNGDSFFLLKEQYPSLLFYELPPYGITYAVGKNASFHALLQTPKILKTIRKEHKVVAEIVDKEKINLIISDNRYGVWHPKIKSVIICHQIALQAPTAFKWVNPLFLKMHLMQLNKFDRLWIPDEKGDINLSGKLSHNINFKMPHTFIGTQSRFAKFKHQSSFVEELNFSVLAVLSGPEPQRSHLEYLLKQQLKNINENVLLVQGKTHQFQRSTEDNITTVSYLNTNDLYAALQKATIIVCRSGYSTIMDLAALGKKAVLIPSEGQTEQEYLAKELDEKGFAVACYQQSLQLTESFEKLKKIKGFPIYTLSSGALKEALKEVFT